MIFNRRRNRTDLDSFLGILIVFVKRMLRTMNYGLSIGENFKSLRNIAFEHIFSLMI